MRVYPQKPPEDLLENEWTTQVIGTKANPGVARAAGWWCYHVLRSRGSAAGYPDWSCLRERHVFIELKRQAQTSKLSDAQRDVIQRIIAAGCEVYVARPMDLLELSLVLTARRRPDGSWSRPGAADAERVLLDRLAWELA